MSARTRRVPTTTSMPPCHHEGGHVEKRDALDFSPVPFPALPAPPALPASAALPSPPALPAPPAPPTSNTPSSGRPGRRVEGQRLSVAARHDDAAFESNRCHADDAVAAHPTESIAVHEEHTSMSTGRCRFGEHRPGHVSVAARLQHQHSAQILGMAGRPVSLVGL